MTSHTVTLVFNNSKINPQNVIFAPPFHTGANPNSVRFMNVGKFKEFIMLRVHNLLHKATNELIKLISALQISKEHAAG